MKRFDIKKIVSLVLIVSLLGAFAGCKKKPAEETEETTEETTIPVVETTTVATTTLMEYAGPLPSSDLEITWTETSIDSTVRYAAVTAGEFLRVRKGPGTDYDIVGTLTRNQEVVVVAVTSSGWYKTSDGFYISGDFLINAPA